MIFGYDTGMIPLGVISTHKLNSYTGWLLSSDSLFHHYIATIV